jgi:hypothetical protein
MSSWWPSGAWRRVRCAAGRAPLGCAAHARFAPLQMHAWRAPCPQLARPVRTPLFIWQPAEFVEDDDGRFMDEDDNMFGGAAAEGEEGEEGEGSAGRKRKDGKGKGGPLGTGAARSGQEMCSVLVNLGEGGKCRGRERRGLTSRQGAAAG